MEISIRQLTNQDSSSVIELVLPIQQLEFGVPITLEDQQDLFSIEAFYRQPGGNFWGAYVDGQLCGTIALVRYNKNSAALRKMFVRKEFRGPEFGLARKLLDELIRYSNMNGITQIYLGTVDILQAAIRFYQKTGFQQIQREELPADFPVMAPDNVFFFCDASSV